MRQKTLSNVCFYSVGYFNREPGLKFPVQIEQGRQEAGGGGDVKMLIEFTGKKVYSNKKSNYLTNTDKQFIKQLTNYKRTFFLSLFGVIQMLLQVLGHAEALDLLLSKDWLHGLVGGKPLLVLRILQVVRLEVGPQLLDNLRSGDLLALIGADDLGQGSGDVQGSLQSGQLLW